MQVMSHLGRLAGCSCYLSITRTHDRAGDGPLRLGVDAAGLGGWGGGAVAAACAVAGGRLHVFLRACGCPGRAVGCRGSVGTSSCWSPRLATACPVGGGWPGCGVAGCGHHRVASGAPPGAGAGCTVAGPDLAADRPGGRFAAPHPLGLAVFRSGGAGAVATARPGYGCRYTHPICCAVASARCGTGCGLAWAGDAQLAGPGRWGRATGRRALATGGASAPAARSCQPPRF